jgi:hypothetical protein
VCGEELIDKKTKITLEKGDYLTLERVQMEAKYKGIVVCTFNTLTATMLRVLRVPPLPP